MSSPAKEFGSAVELAAWLQDHGLQPATWERPPAKTVAMLFKEWRLGEAQLELTDAGCPLRKVQFVSVKIVEEGGVRTLIEASQTLPHGVHRVRGRPLSEKLLPGETWQQGARRGIQEELGSVLPSQSKVGVFMGGEGLVEGALVENVAIGAPPGIRVFEHASLDRPT